MEDKKRKKEDKKKRETSQKVVEQKNKVPELTKPPSAQSPATPNSASPSPGPVPSSTPSAATPAAGALPQGGNNAKRLAVANGQPSPSPQSSQRYMPREVPPRFRCQQDHKVLLKRGQPPLSSMLLGGGNSGADSPNETVASASDPIQGPVGPAAPSLPHTSSSSSIAASTSNYANSMWGTSSGSQPLSQGREKMIVDRSDLEEWPSIAAGDGLKTGDTAGIGGVDVSGILNSSASWGESYLQQQAKVVGGGNGGRKGVNSDSPSPPTSSSSPNECMQSGSVWASSSHELIGGNAVAAGSLPSISKSTPLPGNSDGSLGVSCGIQGANFTPNADPSAWPALVQDGAGTVATEGGSSSLQSSSLSASNALSVNQSSHQHQLHQMQSRDRETSCGKWGSAALEPEAGPKNTGVTEVAEMNSRTTGVGDASSSSSTSSSLWKAQPFPANSKMGSSRTESWKDEAGVSSMSAEGGNAWRFTGQEDREDLTGASAWGTASGGQTSGLSQGAWGGDQILVGEWGTSGGGGGVSNPAGQDGLSSKSSSSSSGGSVGNPTASSSTPSTMTKAWDNQKGVGDVGVGDSSEWGGQGSRGGGGTSSSSGGGNSRSGNQRHGHHRSHQPPNPEVALENLLSRSDLDPRVLSNSGWGQTQIRQNVAWDFEGGVAATPGGVSSSSTLKAPAHTQPFSGSTGTTTTDPSSSNLLQGATLNANLNSNSILGPPSGSPGENWDNSSSSSSSSSLHTRGPPPSNVNMHNPGISQSGGGGGGNQAGVQGKPSGGWGGTASSEEQGKGWDSEGHEWRERRAGSGASGWGDFQKQVTPASGGSGWGESQEDKGSRGWKDMGRGDAGNWGQRASTDWGENEPKSCSSGWGGGKDSGGTSGDSEVGKWGNWDDGAPRGAWGAGGRGGGGDMCSKSHQGWGGKMHPSQMPNSQLASQKGPAQQQQQQQSQPQQCQSMDTGAMQGGWGRPGGPSAQSQSSGWTSGPIPQNASGPVDSSEPSGWEEPSPQSISRKMEIDDGTSAWGDPNNYNYKSVNLWDKNNPPSGQAQSMSPQQGPPSLQQQPTGRMPSGLGNRDMNLTHSSSKGQGTASSGWGGSGSPSSPCVDNGTAAWGKPTDAPTGWGDPEDTGKTSGWGDPSPNPVKSGSKSMQEGWGEGEGSVSASRHSSWEDEDESGGVWNNACSQGSSSSYNSGGWGAKKGSKGSMKGAGDSWMNPMTRQFSKMGMLGEDPNGRSLDLAPGPPQDKKLEGEKRGMCLNEYNGEMHKGGRGGGAGTVFRSPGSKEIGACEPGPYYDKTGGQLFSSGGGMAQPRHQPGVSPINPSVRAQVPHQFLSPQVPGSVLKQMPPPTGGIGGVGGGMFPPQLSPQHIAMLSSIYPPQIQFQLACQLLLQQQPQQQQQQQQQLLQNQRKFPPNIRQQADPQQLARIMAVLQQQRQQQVGGTGGSSKLSPSHLSGSGPKMPMSDPLSHSGLAGSVVDLHQKTPGTYSGFGPGVSLSGLELGPMVGGQAGLKDNGGQQSRFKWMMEGHSPAPSPPDSTLHKNGPIAAPLKMRGGSPYSQYELLGSEGLCVPPQGPSDHWHRSPGNKMGTKTGTSSWPPEFQPGVPWKGIQSVDPESDPYMTPGSMLNSSMSSLNDTEHQLLRDNTESNPSLNTLLPSPGAWPYSASESPHNNAHNQAKYPDYKPSWPPEPIGHNKPWKTNRNSSHLPRPPPGLTHQKQPSVSPWAGGGPRFGRGWGGSGGSQENRFGPGSGAAWSEGGSSRGSCWLVLSNLTPQIDGSTLRTICMQHGPLLTFHLGLTQGSALIRYSTRQEAAKAQSALHMCVLGNTTILAEFVSEEEVARYFAHSQAGAAGSSSGSVGAGGAGSGPVGLTGSSGAGAVGTISSGSGDRERAGVGSSAAGASNNGGGTGPTGSNWQSLDGTGSSPDPASAQGAGLSIFAQWSSNGAGGSVGSNAGVIDPGRAGLWGGMTAGYTSSSLWGSPAMEDRHQMSSPAALLPGDLLGGGADSI